MTKFIVRLRSIDGTQYANKFGTTSQERFAHKFDTEAAANAWVQRDKLANKHRELDDQTGRHVILPVRTIGLWRRACQCCRDLVDGCREELEWERNMYTQKDGTVWVQGEDGDAVQIAEVTLTGAVLRTLFQIACGYVADLHCRIAGHNWEDDSYGGPDSGCMAGHCRRCGYSFHTTLY